MRRIDIPPLAIRAALLAAAVLLPGLLAILGATAGVSVDSNLSLTEAAGAFSRMALNAADRRAAPAPVLLAFAPASSSLDCPAPPTSGERTSRGAIDVSPALGSVDTCPLRL